MFALLILFEEHLQLLLYHVSVPRLFYGPRGRALQSFTVCHLTDGVL